MTVMLNVIVLFIVLLVVVMMLFRVLGLFSDGILFRTRLWPWLRQHPWWPVPAERTAEGLLRHLLTDEQYRALCSTGYLEVPSPAYPERVYRVPRGPGQVLVVERNVVKERLCVQPTSNSLPEADVVLMHKLLIESDERSYLLTANHFPRAIWY